MKNCRLKIAKNRPKNVLISLIFNPYIKIDDHGYDGNRLFSKLENEEIISQIVRCVQMPVFSIFSKRLIYI